MTAQNYIDQIIAAVRAHEPISPFALHSHVEGSLDHLRQALRAALQAGWVQLSPDFELTLGENLPTEDRASSQDEGGRGSSSDLPTPAQGAPPPLPPSPTDHPKSASHPASQTENQMHALRCAIQNEVSLLSRLEDALDTFLRGARHWSGDKVRPAASALLRTATLARKEYEASDRWIRENHPERTDA